MDRTLTLFKPSGHKVAELTFSYDEARWADVSIAEFRQLHDDDDPDDDDKSVYESFKQNDKLRYEPLDSLDKVKAFDRQYVQQHLGRQLPLPLADYRFEYATGPVLLRYVLSTPRGVVGLVDIRFSFTGDTKQVAFRSGREPRFDIDLELTALTTNYEGLSQLELYGEPVLPGCDVAKLAPWY